MSGCCTTKYLAGAEPGEEENAGAQAQQNEVGRGAAPKKQKTKREASDVELDRGNEEEEQVECGARQDIADLLSLSRPHESFARDGRDDIDSHANIKGTSARESELASLEAAQPRPRPWVEQFVSQTETAIQKT